MPEENSNIQSAMRAEALELQLASGYGACTISVYGLPDSCYYLTQQQCNDMAAKYHGTVNSWVGGQFC